MSTRNNKTTQLSSQEFQKLQKASTAGKSSSWQTENLSKPKWAAGRGQLAGPSQRPHWAAKLSSHDCFIGIDPGVSTGVAIKDHRLALPMQLHTLDFWTTTDLLLDVFKQHQDRLLVVIEDPGFHKRVIYARLDKESGPGKREKIAANIGANRREATLLLEFCRRLGIAVEGVSPMGKLTAEEFELQTGVSTGSQHARDAGRLIIGR